MFKSRSAQLVKGKTTDAFNRIFDLLLQLCVVMGLDIRTPDVNLVQLATTKRQKATKDALSVQKELLHGHLDHS